MAHTQTPWRYEASTKTIRSVPANYWLATMDSWDGAIDNQANAEFIVNAVNAFDALVSVAQDALHMIECNCSGDCEGTCTHSMARKALQLANVES